MLLGNTHIDHPVRKILREFNETRSAWHCRGHRNNPFVLLRKLNQSLSEHFGIHRITDCFQHLTRLDFVWGNAMPFEGILFGGRITLTFCSEDMNQHWTVHIVSLIE
ncbi:hypothetical protein D3C73_1405590 [compost metagenome]